jgi:hypothetical protein
MHHSSSVYLNNMSNYPVLLLEYKPDSPFFRILDVFTCVSGSKIRHMLTLATCQVDYTSIPRGLFLWSLYERIFNRQTRFTENVRYKDKTLDLLNNLLFDLSSTLWIIEDHFPIPEDTKIIIAEFLGYQAIIGEIYLWISHIPSTSMLYNAFNRIYGLTDSGIESPSSIIGRHLIEREGIVY